METLVTAITTYVGPLSADTHEQLYQQCRDWYRSYGISSRAVPRSWPEFTEYFADACATQLRRSDTTSRLAEQSLNPPWWAFGPIPGFAARAVQHERATELLGLTARPGDRLKFAAFTAGYRVGPRALGTRRGPADRTSPAPA